MSDSPVKPPVPAVYRDGSKYGNPGAGYAGPDAAQTPARSPDPLPGIPKPILESRGKPECITCKATGESFQPGAIGDTEITPILVSDIAKKYEIELVKEAITWSIFKPVGKNADGSWKRNPQGKVLGERDIETAPGVPSESWPLIGMALVKEKLIKAQEYRWPEPYRRRKPVMIPHIQAVPAVEKGARNFPKRGPAWSWDQIQAAAKICLRLTSDGTIRKTRGGMLLTGEELLGMVAKELHDSGVRENATPDGVGHALRRAFKSHRSICGLSKEQALMIHAPKKYRGLMNRKREETFRASKKQSKQQELPLPSKPASATRTEVPASAPSTPRSGVGRVVGRPLTKEEYADLKADPSRSGVTVDTVDMTVTVKPLRVLKILVRHLGAETVKDIVRKAVISQDK